MKTLYVTLFLLIFFVLSVNAQQRLKLPHQQLTTKLFKVKSKAPHSLDTTQKSTIQNSSSAPTIIGSTIYDYQSNASMPRRIHQYANGSVTCIWNGSLQDQFYNDRGTFINTFNGTSWSTSPLTRIENKITGWCALAVSTNAEHVIAEPNIISSNTGFGTAFDTGKTFTHLTQLRGPHVAASGQYIHIVMAGTEADTSTGFVAPVYYTRSTNAGQSFEPMTANFAAMAGYDTSKHAGNVGPNAYSIDAQGNTVAILVLGVTEDVVLLKSINNGTTWTKTIIREFPIKKYTGGLTDKNGDGLMDTVLGVTGDGSIVIDNDGVVHVVYSDLELFSADTGEITIFPINRSDYMNYWNDADKEIIEVPVLMDNNGNGIFDAGSNFTGNGNIRYGNAGYTLNPQLSVGAEGTLAQNYIFLTYVTVAENDTNDIGVDFRSIYLIYTPNNGNDWGYYCDLSETQNVENAFLTCASTVNYDLGIHLNWQQDFEPGNSVQGQHAVGPSDQIYSDADIAGLRPCFIGIEKEQNFFQLKSYPNPSKNKLEIELTTLDRTNAKLSIINTLGQLMYADDLPLQASKNKLELNISTFESGIYLLLIESAKGRIAQKIIIE